MVLCATRPRCRYANQKRFLLDRIEVQRSAGPFRVNHVFFVALSNIFFRPPASSLCEMSPGQRAAFGF
jgi:hypothetical protein